MEIYLQFTIDRDYRNIKELNKLGWHVITVWDCEIKNNKDTIELIDCIVKKIKDNK